MESIPKEAYMIEISELANEKVSEYVQTNDLEATIRVYLNEGG